MFVNKSAQDRYQLFSGIHEKKLFLQIVDRKGNLKYGFESPELDTTNEKTLCSGIQEACYDFFDPAHFKFDDDFVLAQEEPFLIRRYGYKALIKEQKVIECQSFDKLPAMLTSLFMESFLPFEEPVKRATYASIPGEKPFFVGWM